MRTDKQPCEEIHLARNQGTLLTTSTNLPILEMHLPSILSQDFDVSTLGCQIFSYKIHIHLLIHQNLSFVPQKTLLSFVIALRLHPRRWWIGFFSHVSSHWLVVVVHVASRPLRLCPRMKGASLYSSVVHAREMETVVGSSWTTYLPAMPKYSDSCFFRANIISLDPIGQ